MSRELEHIDDLCRRCGYFNTEVSDLFSGYSYFHPDFGDGDLAQKVKGIWDCCDENRKGFLAKRMTRRNIKCNRRLARKFIKKAKIILYMRDWNESNKILSKYGCKWIGSCYGSACPLGYTAEEEDFIEFGCNPEFMTEGEWLVVDN